ncbi:MAG: DegT/DnrJ/EryC1/StrS family aminotransferase [Proteobacteria bacterium]|nr:DegT/DnrJ/EryC1/StrS family aminotransferase [Pseudomonadota bacterium]
MEIIQNTAFAGGNHVGDFEKEFAAFSKTKHAVGVASGTDALRFALIALGVQEGDEVITVPNTFIATTEAISQAGGIPVFVDVMPDTYNMNPAEVEAKITEKTKVILPVHLYGQMADMEQIMKIAQKHDLKVLEDSCQAHGAELNGKRAGSIGDAAAFSLYPGKNLGAYGEAGCLTTNNLGIARTVSQLRDHGQSEKYYHGMEGYNGRMDNLQAAACRAKIPFMDRWNQERRRVADIYSRNLQNNPNIQIPSVPAGNTPVFHLYVVLVDKPQELQQFLKKRGIFSAFHYPVPLHLQSAYKNRNEDLGSFPVTENCAEKLLSLPMYPELTEEQIIHVCETIEKFYD